MNVDEKSSVAIRNYITRNVSSILMPNAVRKTIKHFDPVRNLDKYNALDPKSIIYQLAPQPFIAPDAKTDLYGETVYRGGNPEGGGTVPGGGGGAEGIGGGKPC